MFKAIFILTLLMTAVTWGQKIWADGPAAAAVAAVHGTAQADLSPEGGLVSLDFQDADIRNVLKVLAFKSGVNIVAAPDVTGVVNIELKDVPWERALNVILSTYGYGFDRKGNIITVMSIDNLKKYRENAAVLQAQEPLVSRTYTLNYAKAEDVLKIIDKLVSRRGFINYDTRTNSIIVRDLESNLELIGGVIKSIDTVTPEVSIETKIVETDLSDNENLGIDWTNGFTSTISGGSVPTYFPFSNKPWKGFVPSSGSGNALFPATSTSLATTPTAGSFTYGTINASQLQATLQYLSTRTTTKILSNPRIVTLDNQKAKINIGLEYPVPNYSFNSSTGQEQVTGFTPLPIGVNFEVTPHVNNAGFITLDLHPQISTLQQTITVQNNPFPETSNQEVETNVMIKDGQTLVIGGMITDQLVTTTNKIPLLGDIPLLGWLFKNTNPVKTRKEVIIFLTPHIITPGKSSSAASATP
ncbi:MAG: type IV pilus secretin PilQ [Candidatus Omnitrophica bacterium]|nr:type IV pilus secretin PilQ [Candidatus Omnitrophota bacterium]MDE2008551.1 type IV pilus secretin PilQ [Candidatus Omnitrophota bacterium]MDE2214017.1 type IV pilus secretin PilQ [Candidatus Omnitrophota bacterium]MDE2231005.1 type IV pilus secretin PilQ [Candidatus Omnitrophota bacterium]